MTAPITTTGTTTPAVLYARDNTLRFEPIRLPAPSSLLQLFWDILGRSFDTACRRVKRDLLLLQAQSEHIPRHARDLPRISTGANARLTYLPSLRSHRPGLNPDRISRRVGCSSAVDSYRSGPRIARTHPRNSTCMSCERWVRVARSLACHRSLEPTLRGTDVRYDCCSCTRQVGWRALQNTGAQGRKEQAFALLIYKSF